MSIRKILFLGIFLLGVEPSFCALSLAEQFRQVGYAELCDKKHAAVAFESLYAYFDELVEFLQKNPQWARTLHAAKSRFVRSKDKQHYATDFFGLYDESTIPRRHQISFYYSIHFHDFICSDSPSLAHLPVIARFFEACREIQKPYGIVFEEAAAGLGLKTLFSSNFGQPPILLKVVKYLPRYAPTRPHYDGTAFSLFLDSTDNQQLLLSPYKASFSVDDFSSPVRKSAHNSLVLIPGTLLAEFAVYPTPHIVAQSGKERWATIAFAMRPHCPPQKNVFSQLPCFKP